MTQPADILERAQQGAKDAPDERASRLALWLIISGFAMMFLAALFMWARFGPSIFVDLATAVANCF